MGLIKTAMMSGAAMYGVNQITKAAANRNPSPQPPPAARRDYSPPRRGEYYYHDRDYNDSYRPRPADPRDRDYPRDHRDYQGRDRGAHYDGEPRQPSPRLYLEEPQRSGDGRPYYQQQYQQQKQTGDQGINGLPTYEYASSTRSSSVPRDSYYPPAAAQREKQGQGFVEQDEVKDEATREGAHGQGR